LGECVVIVGDVFSRGLDFASVRIAPAFGDGAYQAGVGDGLIEAEGNRWRNAVTFCSFQWAFKDICGRM
jgi:hypothetical protein